MSVLAIIIFQLALLVPGAIKGIYQKSQLHKWYNRLIRPAYTPHNDFFPPFSILNCILVATAGYLVWSEESGFSSKHTYAWFLYFFTLVLSNMFAPLFFGLKWMFTSSIYMVVIDIFTFLNMKAFYEINPTACWLMIPYAIFVVFSTYMITGFWWLNKDRNLNNKKE